MITALKWLRCELAERLNSVFRWFGFYRWWLPRGHAWLLDEATTVTSGGEIWSLDVCVHCTDARWVLIRSNLDPRVCQEAQRLLLGSMIPAGWPRTLK